MPLRYRCTPHSELKYICALVPKCPESSALVQKCLMDTSAPVHKYISAGFHPENNQQFTKYNRWIHKDIAIDAIYYQLLQALTLYCTRNMLSRSRQFGTSAEVSFVPKCPKRLRRKCPKDTSEEVSERHFGTGAELSGHFGTSLIVPKCLGSEVSWSEVDKISWHILINSP